MVLKQTGERMIPEKDSGQLIYFEHIGRYLFASQFVKGKKVLDVASGAGYGAALLSRFGAKKVVGIDRSLAAINHSIKNYQKEGITFIRSDAHQLPFNDGVFDIVTTFETIEHLSSQEKFLKEIKRVLKKGGLLILSTPNSQVYKKGNPFHKKELSPKDLSKLILRHFLKINMYYQNSFFANSILSAKNFKEGFFDARNIKGETQIMATTLKLFNMSPDKSLYLNAIASDRDLAKKNDLITLFSPGLPDFAAEKIGNLERNLNDKKRVLREIQSSRGWKIISFFHKIRLNLPLIKRL